MLLQWLEDQPQVSPRTVILHQFSKKQQLSIDFVAGVDYTPIVTQRLTFQAGSSPNDQIPFNVQIIPDVLVEGDETVNLAANSPSNFANVNPDTATLVIDDDDRKANTLHT